MKVSTEEMDNALVIKLVGEMMLGLEANDFHEAVLLGIEKNKKIIIISLKDLKFISSWGIGILIYGYTTATNGGSSFKLAAVPDTVKRTFSKIKIDKIFHLYDTVEDALKS